MVMFPFCTVPSKRNTSRTVRHSIPFCMLKRSNQHILTNVSRTRGSSFTRIDAFTLPQSSKFRWDTCMCCCRSSDLYVFCDRRSTVSNFCYRRSIPIASTTSRSTEVVLLLAFLDSSGMQFELATVRVVTQSVAPFVACSASCSIPIFC